MTLGKRPVDRNARNDCFVTGLLQNDVSTKGGQLASALAVFESSLSFSRTFAGKGGSRRKRGCMVNCAAEDVAADASEAFLAGAAVYGQSRVCQQSSKCY